MKKVSNILKEKRSVIKTVFFVSIFILVLFELLKLRHEVTLNQLSQGFHRVSVWGIVPLIILGLASVLVMIGYDIILNKEIKSKHSLPYILQTSWVINSINNLAGFAGVVDVGLRYSFYADEEESTESMQGISQVIPYFMAGLSLYALISLALLGGGVTVQGMSKFWLILVFAALYLPVILFVSSRNNLRFFGGISKKRISQLVATSFLDWTMVMLTFYAVGLALGYQLQISVLIPLFIISVTVGMASMIPGGLGSFDLLMLASLQAQGISTADSLTWILLFRICYYIIPFCIGIILFLKLMGGKLNEKYLGIPKTVTDVTVLNSQVFLVRLMGISLILSALIPTQLHDLPLIGHVDPIQNQLIWQFPSILLGSLFILVGRLMKRRLKIVLPLTVILYLISLIYVNIGSMSYATSLFLTVIIVLVFSGRSQLTRSSFIYSWEDVTRDVAIFSLTGFIFLFASGQFHPERHLPHHKLHLVHLFSYWIHFVIAALIIYVIFKLILRQIKPKQAFGETVNEERYSAFLERFPSSDVDAFLAYLGDKRLFWYQDNGLDQVVFQFAIENNKCLVMADPIGDATCYREALSHFITQAHQNNLEIIFYEVSQETTLLLHEFGYDFMKFGESADVPLADFSTEGKHGKKFRTSINKIDNKGYTFQVIEQPFDQELLDRLEDISTIWLNGRQEKGFSLGFFDRDYLQKAPIAVVKNPDGDIVAFVNFLITNHQEVSSIDLMRYDVDKAPNGVMDYLFIKLMLYFKEQGVTYFSLGMAPLSNVGQLEGSFYQEKIAYLVYAFSTKFYSFGGLRQYKQKFNPKWSPKYISYPKKTWILYDMIAIFKVDNRQVR
ncbi:bifunctional lysylphosphatidylglycerol flippase/synthetase MprF [Streptococcus saliviloxodontae]|uniref:Phosphatidylglycerol lysyltransferase n=1 Tax=Streptococcus saliviloxodontae TaxID=1349416 RepID=A0ABS2PJ09_9STRE|nr:phosphatidylglycerol lysyltransferase [Streptococcus saliviloxodontae]